MIAEFFYPPRMAPLLSLLRLFIRLYYKFILHAHSHSQAFALDPIHREYNSISLQPSHSDRESNGDGVLLRRIQLHTKLHHISIIDSIFMVVAPLISQHVYADSFLRFLQFESDPSSSFHLTHSLTQPRQHLYICYCNLFIRPLRFPFDLISLFLSTLFLYSLRQFIWNLNTNHYLRHCFNHILVSTSC